MSQAADNSAGDCAASLTGHKCKAHIEENVLLPLVGTAAPAGISKAAAADIFDQNALLRRLPYQTYLLTVRGNDRHRWISSV